MTTMMITLLLLFVAVVTTLGTCPISIPKTNASSYQAFGDDCYYFAADSKDRFDAEGVCLDASGYLTSIHTKEENEFIRKHLSETYGVNRMVFIGLETVFNDNFWLDHSSVEYTNFKGKTDTSDTTFTDQMLTCWTIDPKTGFWSLFKCFTVPREELPFVCKFIGANKSTDEN